MWWGWATAAVRCSAVTGVERDVLVGHSRALARYRNANPCWSLAHDCATARPRCDCVLLLYSLSVLLTVTAGVVRGSLRRGLGCVEGGVAPITKSWLVVIDLSSTHVVASHPTGVLAPVTVHEQ